MRGQQPLHSMGKELSVTDQQNHKTYSENAPVSLQAAAVKPLCYLIRVEEICAEDLNAATKLSMCFIWGKSLF